MSSPGRTSWRMRMAISCLAGVGALYPLGASAQADQPASGAAIAVGGVTAPSGAPVESGGVSAQGPGTTEVEGVTVPGGLPATGGGPINSVQPSVAGAQGRPLVLPNTGGGPQQDVNWLFATIIGLVMIGGGGYLRRRATQH